jgi:hypothetical protein
MASFIVNKGSGSAGTPVPIQIPDINSYKAISVLFTQTNDPASANVNLIKAVNEVYTSVTTPYSSTGLQYIFDISGGLFQILSSNNPIGFYNDIYSVGGCPSAAQQYCVKANNDMPSVAMQSQKPVDTTKYRLNIPNSLVNTIPITIFGTPSTMLEAAKLEMSQSIELCNGIFLGAPQFIENYIRIEYPTGVITNTDSMKVYVRNAGSKYWCMPDIVQIFSNGAFNTQVATLNQTWNTGTGQCKRELTPTLLALLPYATRNFIIEWIRNRRIRYITYYNSIDPTKAIPMESPRISLPPLSIDTSSSALLDSIAQQFYELLGGQYSMSYIYDVLPLGTTMLDIRFNLIIHVDSNTTYGPIADLKAQYRGFLNSGSTLPQNTVDQAAADYQDKLNSLEQQGISNSTRPFQGAVVRLFYTAVKGIITINGMIFDSRAVTSFIKELNSGLIVPLGPMDGNINYTPNITYTLNEPQQPLDCRDPSILRSIMDDYMGMVQIDKSILLAATNPVDTSLGNIFVSGITGSTQVSPTQCAIDWTENVYDIVTNKPLYNNILRRGIMSYYMNKEDWFAQNLTFAGPSGFKLYPTTANIPACEFNTQAYVSSTGNRYSTTTGSTIINDFLTNTFKNGQGDICPQTIPMYKFSAKDYNLANTSVTVANALSHFTANLQSGTIVKPAFSVAPLTTPINYTKPLPEEASLDTASSICPVATCTDLDILYGLATQYNSNPSHAGAILNIQRAYTAGPNQCDIEAQINYDAMITDILPASTQVIDPATGNLVNYFPSIKKGTVSYSQPTSGSMKGKTVESLKAMTRTGIQTVTIALYVDIDKTDCSYLLADASGANSGHTIQQNTPLLYKPLNYAMELQRRSSQVVGSSVSQIQSNFNSAAGSIKPVLQNYRMNTYSAIGSINTLTCNKTCSSMGPNILINYVNSTGTYYKTRNITAVNVLNVATFNSNTCDLTFSDNSIPPKKYGARISLNPTCTGGISLIPINPTPTYADVQDMTMPLTTAAVSGFTDYSTDSALDKPQYIPPPTEDAYPLKARGFGRDLMRNSADTFKEIQFMSPLQQEIPVKEEGNNTRAYKFIRFVPLKTRDPDAESVAVSRFTFFYQGQPIALEGRVSNPMGTWEGNMNAVSGLRPTGWIDHHKKPIVFAFKSPIIIDAYGIMTSLIDSNADPVAWKLEVSSNGTFWTVVDSQSRFSTPIERGKETHMIYIS